MLRVRVMAVALLLASVVRGGDVSLPAIFAPKPAGSTPGDAQPTARRAVALPRTGALSERLTKLISAQVLAKAGTFDVSQLPVASANAESATVVMEKFEVRGEKVQPIELGPTVTPALRFLRTGRFLDAADGKVVGDLRLLPVRPAGALPKEEVMRVEVSFRIAW